MPDPGGDSCVLTLWIEPFVLNGSQTVTGTEGIVHTVQLHEQVVIMREEFIFSVRQVDRNQLQMVCLVFLHEPFQRHGVPKDNTVILGTDLGNGIPHVVIGLNLHIYLVVNEIVMAETALMHDDTTVGQVIDILYIQMTASGNNDTVGKELYNGVPIG